MRTKLGIALIAGKGSDMRFETLRVIIVGTVLALALMACGPAQPQGGAPGPGTSGEPQDGGMVRVASPWNPTDLDVHGRSRTGNFRRFVWDSLLDHERKEPLYDFRIDYALAPALAERWEQPDPTTYIFHLRKGVKWHDGADFTAKDVIFTFEHVLEPKNKYSTANLEGVERFEALDDHTVKVTMRAPSAEGLKNIGDLWIVGKHQGDRGDDFEKVAIGTGSMKVAEFERNAKVVLTRNDQYWEKGKPHLDRFESVVGLDRSGQLAAFAARQSDFMVITDRPQFTTVSSAVPNLQSYSYAPGYNYGFRFNVDEPPYSDPRVRKAFLMAIDRYEMRNTLAHGEGVINSFAAPGFRTGWGLSEPELQKMPGWRQPKQQDLQEARRLLADAGYPDGLKTRVVYDQTNSFHPYMTEIALGQLHKAGIQAEGAPQESGAYSKTYSDGSYEVMAAGGITEANPDRDLTDRYASSGKYAKAASMKDARLDELIAQQGRELNVEKRKQLFREIDRHALEQAYFVPTISGAYYGVWQPYLHNVYPGFAGQPWMARTQDLWIDLEQAPSDRRTR